MSDSSGNNSPNYFFQEGQIAEENTEIEEGQEEGQEEEPLWGGTETNEVITDIRLLPLLLGLQLPPLTQALHPQLLPSPPLEPLPQQRELSRKRLRDESGNVVLVRENPFGYLKLVSGQQFYFTEDDGKNILLNERLEPNKLIRNIISKLPKAVEDRLDFLSKFDSEEDSLDDETGEEIEKRYDGILKDLVLKAYIKEFRLRYIFKRIVNMWKIKKMNQSSTLEVDPITLLPPEKEVYVYDWNNRRKFILDAKSLANLIESKLHYHEYGFPMPMFAKNPSNNVEFTYKQYVSIYTQLKHHGELRWGLTTLREYNFDKARWQTFHRSALTIGAIRNNLKPLDTTDARELLLDFVLSKMEELNIRVTNHISRAYELAMFKVPNHWYLEKLKWLAMVNYESEHFGHYRKRFINSSFIKIIKRQQQFIKELEDKKII